jgi:hypothetical protein
LIEQVGGDHRSMLDPPHWAALWPNLPNR